MRKSIGFTLIEILIVVAIISILSAIAVPNFLEAQTRSKVSRARADMHTIATALEVYRIDNNHYPPMCENYHGWKWCPCSQSYVMGLHDRVPNHLSSPISYLTQIPDDVFGTSMHGVCVYESEEIREFEKRYKYQNPNVCDPGDEIRARNNLKYIEIAGAWLLYSSGPDEEILGSVKDMDNLDGLLGKNINYDPTNGAVSRGNIFRTQKDPKNIQMLDDDEWSLF